MPVTSIGREHLDEAIALHQETGDRYGEAVALVELSRVHCETGKHALAAELAERAVEIVEEIADRGIGAHAQNALGAAESALGRHRRALDHHATALRTARELDARYPETDALLGMALAYRSLESSLDALDHVDQARHVASCVGYQVLLDRITLVSAGL